MIQTTLDFGMTEAQKKKKVLDAMENDFPKFLEGARKWARHFCYSNKGFGTYKIDNCVTTDDIRKHFEIPVKANGDNSLMGQILRKGFRKTGDWYASKTEGSHGRPIVIWQRFPGEAK